METKIGRALIAGDIPNGATISLDADDERLVVRWENEELVAAAGSAKLAPG